MRIVQSALLVLAALCPGTQASAQFPEQLPITGSVVYNAIIYNQARGTERHDYGFRFAGRVAARVARDTYVGAGVGSWVRQTGSNCYIFTACANRLDAQSEAIVHQVYLQQYLVRHRAFARVGVGPAITSTLQAGGNVIEYSKRWRPALTTGVGFDLRLARFLYLTPSFDVTVLPGADTAHGELRSAIAPGIAITLR
jgi:hypothetical protein